jgi:mono/diheme cytochrome c family protein
MAATDKNYRNQYGLDIVFAVSSILMLLSTLWMFIQDYNREFKKEQRTFRDVETAMAQRQAIAQIPSREEFDKARKAVEDAKAERKNKEDAIRSNKDKISAKLASKERADRKFQDIKSELESITSFYDSEMEHNAGSKLAQRYKEDIAGIAKRLQAEKAEKDNLDGEILALRQENDRIESNLNEALARLKKVTDTFDVQVKTAIKNQWRFGDWVRTLPIIDGFASPLKIQQFTIEDIPIDYNFKYATRFDRCMSCHQGLDRPAYTREALKALTEITDAEKARLKEAQTILAERLKALEGLPEAKHVPHPDQLDLMPILKEYLTPARINEFCAHPRLELFVGSNSKHPAERFGCTSCHSGQGSATSFNLASHTPTDTATMKLWKKEHDWESNHYWDFPMLPMRFVESSCLKCHYEVTDLIGRDNRQEAPKLLRGYYLLRENGCFGCHEINGRKKGRPVGPDIRLENYPPLEKLTFTEQTKIEADPDTRPGNMRKVGPSLFRLNEKTNADWAVKWLRAPREFRPDTKMPHFYGLSNNDPSVLPEAQKDFPDAEMQAIVYYLFQKSKETAELRKEGPEALKKDVQQASEHTKLLAAGTTLPKEEQERLKQELKQIEYRIRVRNMPELKDRTPPGYKGDAGRGRILFSERGCLACHTHEATYQPQGKAGSKDYAPAIEGEAQFGPNLSQVAGKLGGGDKNSARIWLVQWVLDPHVHSPRSRMPVTHLTPEEATDLAAWLLSQPAQDVGPEWNTLKVEKPSLDTLKRLADVYLVRLLSQTNMEDLKKDGSLAKEIRKDLPEEERDLTARYDERSIKMYVGRKAIGRLGCFACHDIPGFEFSKPIGVELNDWGKKDPTRLAFEDIVNYAKATYHVVPSLTDAKGKPEGPEIKDGKKKLPYEQFFYDLLAHHQREGFLHQKLMEPRSYDYGRLRAWDDRARMPQFKFARSRPHKDEAPAAFEARSLLEEAKAREAVMTFVLGLVAEPVPLKSVHQPQGDRMAEVQGRQVLDKFNCAGCHLIRPGVFDFKVTKEVISSLENSLADQSSDYDFTEHFNWGGPTPSPSSTSMSAFGLRPMLAGGGDSPKVLSFFLAHALRFKGTDGAYHDIRPGFRLVRRLPAKDVTYPPQTALESQEKLDAFMKEQGPFGGAFTDLLAQYLAQKDPDKYKGAESGEARISGPPVLIGQGERTQGDWLNDFLQNPQRIRKLTVLQMPRFNMAPEEAKALVAYFAAVERLNNPGIGLGFPFEKIPQNQELTGTFWKERTATYIDRLKQTKDKDKPGKTLYQERLQKLQQGVWPRILKDYEEQRSRAMASWKAAAARSKELGDDKKAGKAAIEEATKAEKAWKDELDHLEQMVSDHSLARQQKAWEEREAYVADGFRMLNGLCVKCHQVGTLQPSPDQIQGPPLELAARRLQPGWSERWIANPQRFIPSYITVMPANFPANQHGQFQEWIAGSPLEQVLTVRDVLMIAPRAVRMPINRYWALPVPADKKTGANNKGDAK